MCPDFGLYETALDYCNAPVEASVEAPPLTAFPFSSETIPLEIHFL